MAARQGPEKSRPRDPMTELVIYEPSGDLSAHPAAHAWSKLQGRAAKPCSIDVLRPPRKDGHKACIFRISGVGREGSSIVAKLCLKEIAQVERLIYETILPDLPIPKLEFYGTMASEDPEMDWVFVEDAGDERYSPNVEEHRHIAAEWIAALHTSAESLLRLKQLPDRGPTHYLNHLRSARWRIDASRSNTAITWDQRTILDRVAAYIQSFEDSWNELERLCETMPRTLAHGDWAERNVRLRGDRGRRKLVVFDWETGGQGVPAVDLASSRIYTSPCCLRAYFSQVRKTWPALSFEDVVQMARVGRIFRVIAAIDWASVGLSFEQSDYLIKPVSLMQSYLGRIEDVLREPVETE